MSVPIGAFTETLCTHPVLPTGHFPLHSEMKTRGASFDFPEWCWGSNMCPIILYHAALLTRCLKKSSWFLNVVFHPVSSLYNLESELARLKICWTVLVMALFPPCCPSPCLPSHPPPPLCSHAVFLPISPSLCPPFIITLALMTSLLLFPSLSQKLMKLQLIFAQTSKNATKTLWYRRAIHHPQTLTAFSQNVYASKLSRKSEKVMQIK